MKKGEECVLRSAWPLLLCDDQIEKLMSKLSLAQSSTAPDRSLWLLSLHRAHKSHEVLMFVCLKQRNKVMLDCTYCSGRHSVEQRMGSRP